MLPNPIWSLGRRGGQGLKECTKLAFTDVIGARSDPFLKVLKEATAVVREVEMNARVGRQRRKRTS